MTREEEIVLKLIRESEEKTEACYALRQKHYEAEEKLRTEREDISIRLKQAIKNMISGQSSLEFDE